VASQNKTRSQGFPGLWIRLEKLLSEAEEAIRKDNIALAQEKLNRYLKPADAPEREKATGWLNECNLANLSPEGARGKLQELLPKKLLSWERGEEDIESFEFENLEQKFNNILRAEYAQSKQQIFAGWLAEARRAIGENRVADAIGFLDRYLSVGDVPERAEAESLQKQCKLATIGNEEAANLLSQMNPEQLRALEQGMLVLSIGGFQFTHPNLEQDFYARLREHAAALRQGN
jgi:hypothetical protein